MNGGAGFNLTAYKIPSGLVSAINLGCSQYLSELGG